MTIRLDHPTDPDAFLRWPERQERKFEPVDNELIVTNGSKRHVILAGRLLVVLNLALKGSRFSGTTAGFPSGA